MLKTDKTKNSKYEKVFVQKKFFPEPKALPVTQDKSIINKRYKFWRNSIFITSYVIYLISYLCRKNFSIAAPLAVGLSSKDMGIVLAIGSITYGIGKFVNGSFADKSNVRYALPFNSMMAGVCSALLAFASWINENFLKSHLGMLIYMCLFWGVSQWFQSALFPYCAKSLVRWFPNSTRATWWARWSTSHELGSFIAMNISLPIAAFSEHFFGKYGLEAMFIVPFILSILVGTIGIFSLRDRPISIGLPDVEEICSTKKNTLTKEEKKELDKESQLTYFQILQKYVLKNKIMWNLSIVYFCVYVFRNGPVDWIFKILVDQENSKNFSNFKDALKNTNSLDAFKASTLCLIGFLGTLFAPFISEKLFKGKRAPANFWSLFIGSFSLIGVWLGSSSFSPINNNFMIKNIIIFLSLGISGFTVCVPQVLVGGICAIESSSKRVASAATGFASLLGYFGAAFGHIINGFILNISNKNYGDARLVLIYWGVIALLGALLCVPLWNVKANKEYSH
ncbi:MAG: MFS transporter [Oscillospiraceae bacterium]|jgi:OPA family sugar phosphate sensor protein UhpC-like MFS transporter|nr:MFS transporter [Oscillospiraceae bacterium]